MKTLIYALRASTIFVSIIASLTACASEPTYTALNTHVQQQTDSPPPIGSFSGEDENLAVTVRVMQSGESNDFVMDGACYQIEVVAQSKTSSTVMLGGNDISVNGAHVPVRCNYESFFQMPDGFGEALKGEISGSTTDTMKRAVAWKQTLLARRILVGHASTQGYDYVPKQIPKEGQLDGFYFVYKLGEEIRQFRIPFTQPVSVATTASAP